MVAEELEVDEEYRDAQVKKMEEEYNNRLPPLENTESEGWDVFYCYYFYIIFI